MKKSITLVCSICNSRNYKTTKSNSFNDKMIEVTKFCKSCNTRTNHHEER